ncbi:hypothetical protein L4693_003864 [Pseudomonas aeruginosa]|nr:hypothetical protein [Pseudomonas aeruginosa]
MLVIRFKGWSVKLDHQVGSAGKHGIWSFHGSESSYLSMLSAHATAFVVTRLPTICG